MIVLDTNVLSEPMRPSPERRVLAWLNANAGALWTSSVTVQEVVYGIWRLKEEPRRELLRRKFEEAFLTMIGSRVLVLDVGAGRLAGLLSAQRANEGRPISLADAQIAAIAQSNNATLATRDVDDFAGLGLPLVNPWEA
jgi:predicted nucleic acid-binding protein